MRSIDWSAVQDLAFDLVVESDPASHLPHDPASFVWMEVGRQNRDAITAALLEGSR